MNQGSGSTYAYSGQTTEWEDILIKKGIRTKEEVLLEKGLNPLDFIEKKEDEEEPEVEDKLAKLDLDELDELEDDYEDDRILEHYRQQRLQEMKQAMVKNRFGELLDIIKDDWVREVTDGSKSCPVVVLLYDNALIECRLMEEALRVLAAKFRYIKFLKIKYNHAIENWPERNLPTVFVYVDGALKTQLITLKQVGGLQMNASDVEWFLVQNKIITDSELECDPREIEDENGGKSGVKILRGRQF